MKPITSSFSSVSFFVVGAAKKAKAEAPRTPPVIVVVGSLCLLVTRTVCLSRALLSRRHGYV